MACGTFSFYIPRSRMGKMPMPRGTGFQPVDGRTGVRHYKRRCGSRMQALDRQAQKEYRKLIWSCRCPPLLVIWPKVA